MSVHEDASAVLAFWFDELTPEQHWTKSDALDAEIARRFGVLRDCALADTSPWTADADTLLAAIILLDQFSRNIHRDTPRAFEADAAALDLTLLGIGEGWHRQMEPLRRGFFYMPLMHAEDRGVQRFALRCFAEPGLEKQIDFARDHAAVIERFGRYPTRNAILGRTSTPEELEYLSQPDVGW
ncbi:DUF924 family protein [Sphingosinicella microcystinivorans]|uniref:Membrane protein n=1 Tax=Sphingosinicella microcystinivorans TaxID=335406 RepID=A0AAD1D4Y6_SPHMI|nr:DUF924 family protein [Sphingosinicella microcystinivorans]RKS90760.1 uncharacterized protein (DUF924 family) [Sphingosinicella microcystinivorans]BBE33675.1 membrane protein [Sphingosinicella microcystinivorans]